MTKDFFISKIIKSSELLLQFSQSTLAWPLQNPTSMNMLCL